MARSRRLRLSIVVNLLAAVAVTFGLSAVALLAVVRVSLTDVLVRETGRVADVAGTLVSRGIDPASGRWLPDGTGFRWLDAPTCAPCARMRGRGGAGELVVERVVAGRAFEVAVPLSRVQDPLNDVVARLLLFLAIASVGLVVIGVFLLERGLVRRLDRLDEALGAIERHDLAEPLLSSPEGDEIGRLVGVVRRVGERLRDDRAARERHIEGLEAANRELRETREELLRSEKLATVGRLAAGVAHEIGNPLAAVIGYLEVLKLQPGTLPEGYAERIDRELRRIDRIVRDLLDVARPRAMVLEPLSLGEVLSQAGRLVRTQAKWRDMTLETTIPADLPPVVAQAHYLTQVLVNLMMNAADATQGRGRVRLEAADEGSQVTLRVSDDGPGIAEGDVGRVFEPFFTTKQPGEGTGLGLAIVHALMLQFGGGITVEGTGGPGAVFTLRFRKAPGATTTG